MRPITTAANLLRTTTWIITLAGFGAAISLGALAVANTVSTLPSPHEARLGRLIDMPTLPDDEADVATDDTAALATDAPASDVQPETSSSRAEIAPPATTVVLPPVRDASVDSAAPMPKPKAVAARPVAKPARPISVLSDAQIAIFKRRLKLSPNQQSYWPAIEASLRDVVRQIDDANRRARGGAVPVDVTTPEVERLKNAAIPLLIQMRPDQKAEIVALAHTIGMDEMAAML